jgi:lipoprotein-anchoring transpeptidase ErfK/SrfK
MLIFGAVLVGCSETHTAATSVQDTVIHRVAAGDNLVAQATGPRLGVFSAPGARTPVRTLSNPLPSGAPRVLLVTADHGDWLEVLLPVRPNGSTGWVRNADVKLVKHQFRIVVELGAHRVTVLKGNGVLLQTAAGIGTIDTPTPPGLYYTVELLKQPDPNGAYGPYAYGLSGYSNVLTTFAGGDGELGLHGTNDPGSLGHDISHGCIRIDNTDINRLALTLPLGVPVRVLP